MLLIATTIALDRIKKVCNKIIGKFQYKYKNPKVHCLLLCCFEPYIYPHQLLSHSKKYSATLHNPTF